VYIELVSDDKKWVIVAKCRGLHVVLVHCWMAPLRHLCRRWQDVSLFVTSSRVNFTGKYDPAKALILNLEDAAKWYATLACVIHAAIVFHFPALPTH